MQPPSIFSADIPHSNADIQVRGTYKSRYGYGDQNGNLISDADQEYVDGHTLWNITLNQPLSGFARLQVGLVNAWIMSMQTGSRPFRAPGICRPHYQHTLILILIHHREITHHITQHDPVLALIVTACDSNSANDDTQDVVTARASDIPSDPIIGLGPDGRPGRRQRLHIFQPAYGPDRDLGRLCINGLGPWIQGRPSS